MPNTLSHPVSSFPAPEQLSGNEWTLKSSDLKSENIGLLVELCMPNFHSNCMSNKLLAVFYFWLFLLFLKKIKIDPVTELSRTVVSLSLCGKEWRLRYEILPTTILSRVFSKSAIRELGQLNISMYTVCMNYFFSLVSVYRLWKSVKEIFWPTCTLGATDQVTRLML